MECRKIQKLILSDYTDGELNSDSQKQVQDHLSGCAKCGQFQQDLQSTIIDPLRKAELLQPPESVWQTIKSTIEDRETQTAKPLAESIDRFRERLRVLLIPRKPAFAVAVVTILILVVGIFSKVSINKRNVLNIYLEEQITFLDCLDAKGGHDSSYAGSDIEVSLEELFL